MTPFLVLIVSSSLFFPYITGKGFFFRILIEILFGFWLSLLILNPTKYLPRKNILLYAVLIFVFALFLADIFGVNPYKSFWSNYERMEGLVLHLHLLTYFLMLISVFRSKKDWFIFFHISIFVSLIVAGYAYFENFGFIKTLSGGRVFSTIGNPIYLAAYLLIHFFILAFYYFQSQSPKLKAVYGLIFLFELPVFFFTETRGAFLGFLAGLGLIFFLKFLEAKSFKAKTAFASFLVVALLVPLLLVLFQGSGFIKSHKLLNRFASISILEKTVQARLMIWDMSLKSWTQRPVFGWGQDNFISAFAKNYNPRLYGNEPWFDRTHNTPLQWLAEAGALGFLAYLFAIFSVVFLLLRIHRKKILNNNQTIVSAGFALAYFVQGLFVFDTLATYFLICALLGFLYFYTTEERKSEINFKIAEHFKYGLIVSAIGLSIFLVFFINYKPIKHSRAIIDALKNISQNQNQEVVSSGFDKVLEINSFGLTEAREQLGNFLVQLAISTQILNQGYFHDLLERGISEMKNETERDPSNVRPLIFYGKLEAVRAGLTGQGFEEAENAYKKAIELGPHYIQSHLALAELYLLQGDRDKANKIISGILEFAGDVPEIYDPVATFYVLTQNYNRAWIVIGKSADLGAWPSPSDFVKWGSQALKQGDFAEARRFSKIALKESLKAKDKKSQINSMLILAEAEAKMGNKEKSIFYAKEAEKLNPDLKAMVEKFIESLN